MADAERIYEEALVKIVFTEPMASRARELATDALMEAMRGHLCEMEAEARGQPAPDRR